MPPTTRGLGYRRIWAATIDYTPDHLPILGPGLDGDGRPIGGVTVASAGGHGMMWGPGVARVAADLVTGGATDPVSTCREISGSIGSTRPAAARLAADPIALPFPTTAPVYGGCRRGPEPDPPR